MVFRKKIIILLYSCTLILRAQELNDDFTLVETISVEKGEKAQQPLTIWTFEIENQTDAPLYIQMYHPDGEQALLPSGQGTVAGKQGSKPGYLRASGIDPTKELIMYVWWKKEDRDIGRQVDLGLIISPTDKKEYRANRMYIFSGNAERRSIFLTWNKGEPKLAPAKTSGIFDKKTASGIPVKKNITTFDIQKKILSSEQ